VPRKRLKLQEEVANASQWNDGFNWQAEYGVVSFGGKQLDMVIKYVKNQRAHHSEGTIIPFLERIAPEDMTGTERARGSNFRAPKQAQD